MSPSPRSQAHPRVKTAAVAVLALTALIVGAAPAGGALGDSGS
jgi:hypothetical protein